MARAVASSPAPSLPIPRLSTATRGLLAGGIVTFVACLLAAELLLNFGAGGHLVRASLLGIALVVSIGLAGALHPEDRVGGPLDPAERDAGERAFAAAPGSPVAIQGAVRVGDGA